MVKASGTVALSVCALPPHTATAALLPGKHLLRWWHSSKTSSLTGRRTAAYAVTTVHSLRAAGMFQAWGAAAGAHALLLGSALLAQRRGSPTRVKRGLQAQLLSALSPRQA